MGIATKEDQLFVKWKDRRPGFVADGVVDEKAYCESDRKLLFVLKEVNDLNGGGWDLREFVREGGRAQTWNNIARWVRGIRRLDEDLLWSDVDTVDEDRRKSELRSLCVVNLKKSPGHHTSVSDEVAAASYEDKDLLGKQFALYEADVVICCGSATSNAFHNLGIWNEPPQWRMTRRGIWFHEYATGKFVIEYSHPEARCASCLLYYGIVDALREILT